MQKEKKVPFYRTMLAEIVYQTCMELPYDSATSLTPPLGGLSQ
jgi:hypothetical protein